MSKLREAIEGIGWASAERDYRGENLKADLLPLLDAHEAAEAQRWAAVREKLEEGLAMMPLAGSAGVNSIREVLALIPPAPAVEPSIAALLDAHQDTIHETLGVGRPIKTMRIAPPEKCARCDTCDGIGQLESNGVTGTCADCGGSGERQ